METEFVKPNIADGHPADTVTSSSSIASRPRTLWQETIARTFDNDALVVEEPLEIRVGTFPLAVLMRTPGHDIELSTGFALTEMLVKKATDLARVVHCDVGESPGNVIRIIPESHVSLDPTAFQRSLFTTSSCGVCGKRSIEKALAEAPPLETSHCFEATMLARLPRTLRRGQPDFSATGALHAAAVAGFDGKLLCVREDIGRHNAVDKVVGWAARSGTDLTALALVVSGRASFEIIQKALSARISCVVAIGGASSLAVDLASRTGIALIGFARESRLSIYSGSERIK